MTGTDENKTHQTTCKMSNYIIQTHRNWQRLVTTGWRRQTAMWQWLNLLNGDNTDDTGTRSDVGKTGLKMMVVKMKCGKWCHWWWTGRWLVMLNNGWSWRDGQQGTWKESWAESTGIESMQNGAWITWKFCCRTAQTTSENIPGLCKYNTRNWNVVNICKTTKDSVDSALFLVSQSSLNPLQ